MTISSALPLILTALLLLHGPAIAQIAQVTPSSMPVIVAPSTSVRDSVDLDIIGSGSARHSVVIFPAVAGEVVEVAFRTGQSVRAGQVLLRLLDRQERLAVDLAAAQVDTASKLVNRHEATRGSGAVPERVLDEALAVLRAARITLAQARVALADRVVLAPFAGIVGLSDIERGDRVTTASALTTIDDRRVLLIDFDVPEPYLARVAPGHLISAVNPAYPDRSFAGKVSEIDSRVDPISRNVRMRAQVANTADLLRPGMSFAVRLSMPGKTFVSVPELALQWDRNGSFVWVIRADKSVKVAVRLVRRTSGRVLVDGALTSDETVVVEGVQRLREGNGVRIVGSPVEKPAGKPVDGSVPR
ncbi:MAG: RND family efflux transporter MFP subunit [Bradyrhizobium sp.]|jgi:RND family efflux transporter MFP subunit